MQNYQGSIFFQLFIDIRNLKVFTDSRYVEGCVNVWRRKWESNGWINSKNRPVENKELIQQLCKMADEDINLTVVRIKLNMNFDIFYTSGF